jgi:hypothetical protein
VLVCLATYLASDHKTNPAPALSHGGLFMGPVQLSSHYQDDRASRAGYCPNEEDQFRHQYPIATHFRLNCLDESAPFQERWLEWLTNG